MDLQLAVEEIRQTARVYYNTSPTNVRDAAREFFRAMDYDGDGWISLPEFTYFMTQEGQGQLNNPYLFQEINRNRSGYLDFDDVMALYYIIKSRSPFCGGCMKLIGGRYFTCVDCFESDATNETFCLHPSCYETGNYHHLHKLFVDNNVMLHQLRERGGLARANRIRRTQSAGGSSSNNPFAIFPAENNQESRRDRCKKAFEALEKALGFANFGATICTLM